MTLVVSNTTLWDYHPESCNQCDAGEWPADSDHDVTPFTKCRALQLDADHAINHDHVTCVAHGLTFHPVISNVRDACTCYQPQEDEVASYQVYLYMFLQQIMTIFYN